MKPKSLMFFAVAAAALVVSAGAHAQAWPNKPIKIIIPFPPGNTTDIMARLIAPRMSERLGQPVIVENRPGASGMLGLDLVAKAAPDGYTIGAGQGGNLVVLPHTSKSIPYDALKDFTPLTLAVTYVNILVITPNHPAKTVKELVEYAKANPGKVSFGSAGNGSSNHLSGEVLKTLSGAPMQHIPYKGSAPALTDVMSGNITFMYDILNTSLPQARAGRVRALAVTSARRSPYAPEVPTMEEAGVPGYSAAGSDLWFGIMGPAGMPRSLVERIHRDMLAIVNDPEFRDRELLNRAYEPSGLGPDDFAALIKRELAVRAELVRVSGARVE